MIEVKANMKAGTTELSAAGSMADLLLEFSMATEAFTKALLSPFNTEPEYMKVKVSLVQSVSAGIAKAYEDHRKEVEKHECSED